MFKVSRYVDISCGHRVLGHEGKCGHLHGHNYRIHFECTSDTLDQVGRVIDFQEIQNRLCGWVEHDWDHRFLVSDQDLLGPQLAALDETGVIFVPFNPTAENMARYLVEEVGPEVLEGTGILLVKVIVEETRKCTASYEVKT